MRIDTLLVEDAFVIYLPVIRRIFTIVPLPDEVGRDLVVPESNWTVTRCAALSAVRLVSGIRLTFLAENATAYVTIQHMGDYTVIF